jgi:hypothetical protein
MGGGQKENRKGISDLGKRKRKERKTGRKKPPKNKDKIKTRINILNTKRKERVKET